VLRALIVLLVSLGAAGTLSAQAGQGFAVPGVAPGRAVRVAVPGEGRVSGDVLRVDAAGLTLDTDAGARTFATLPDTLWTRGRAVLPGTIVGGAAGIAGGILLGLVANALCEYDCGAEVGYAAAGGLLGGIAGAGLGALVGAGIPRWQRRLP
jgi:hypothetical protein